MVFDASARVSVGYDLMHAAGMPLRVMSGPPLSYENAFFHHMNLGAGRSSLANPTRLNEVIFEASSKIDEDDDPWLVVYNDVQGLKIREKLAAACKRPERLSFVK
ncbi:hypothetical protein [uncultured Sphingomonas sp.]|uniref:hypothetical protein n=1 Tax=uncultured Sphingomonas sp. TaxID=158754 RepID=UPI0026004AEB|nr:hypothetical protein [uncultured Sphingomonas sp.]